MSIADIVIISFAKNQVCKKTTEDCIKSLIQSEENSIEKFNIIVVESQEDIKWEYLGENVHTYQAPLPYGYHKFLNFGRKKGNAEWVVLCNNDLEFNKGWFTDIELVAESNPNVLSFSPICPLTQPQYNIKINSGNFMGYQVRGHVSGWCIVQKRTIYDIIGDLDEQFFHWFCDNDYAMTLQKYKIPHVLVTSSIVKHHDRQTGKVTDEVVITESEKYRLTFGSQQIFINKWV